MTIADSIRAELRTHADPVRGAGQQRYVKSTMPCLGVRVPVTRTIAFHHVKGLPLSDILKVSKDLWDNATHREERLAAIVLLSSPGALGDERTLKPLKRYAIEGAWWDLVDAGIKALSAALQAHPETVEPLIRQWATHENFWIRRLAILGPSIRTKTDPELLAAVIEPNVGDQEFFIRKAIGWALRDYAYTNPAWVKRFVASHDLSPLSRREALKHLANE